MGDEFTGGLFVLCVPRILCRFVQVHCTMLVVMSSARLSIGLDAVSVGRVLWRRSGVR
jgi:hypothetical protein